MPPPKKNPTPRSSAGFAAPHGEALLLGRSGGWEGRQGLPSPSRESAPAAEASSPRPQGVLTQPALRAGAAGACPSSAAAGGSPGTCSSAGRTQASAAGARLRRLRPAAHPPRPPPGRRDRPGGGGPSLPSRSRRRRRPRGALQPPGPRGPLRGEPGTSLGGPRSPPPAAARSRPRRPLRRRRVRSPGRGAGSSGRRRVFSFTGGLSRSWHPQRHDSQLGNEAAAWK